MATSRIYCATAISGGATGALDTIDGDNLTDNDMAIVVDYASDTVSFWRLEASGGHAGVENTDFVVPDDNAGTKEWWLQKLIVDDITVRDDVITIVDDISVGDALTVGGASEFKGAVQIGDADGTGAGLTIYSDTVGDHIVYDETAKTFTFTDISLVANLVDINGGAIDGTTIGAAAQAAGDFTAIGAVAPGTIVGTTIDATTDFTVGGTVITDATITDDGILKINATTQVDFESAGLVTIGTNGTQRGELRLYGDDAGAGVGGYLRLYTDAGEAVTDRFDFKVTGDILYIGTEDDTDMLTLSGDADTFNINCNWDATGVTCSDLGAVTTVDINGGSIDNTAIGAAVASTAIFTTCDATTDFTIGATIITDGTITDAGDLTITTPDLIVSNGDLYVRNAGDDVAQLSVGLDTNHRGSINVFGENTGSDSGGEVKVYVSDDNDTNIDFYYVAAYQDDLYIGPAGNPDAFKLVGVGADCTAQFTVATDVDAALTATTVDADTDFTVGGTVITDATITDDGILVLTSPSGVQIKDTVAANDVLFMVGVSDAQRGIVAVYGDAAGDTDGGQVLLYTAADHDGTGIDSFEITVSSDDLKIGPNQLANALIFTGSGVDAAPWGSWTFNAPVDVDAALTATTVDADTDFTVGGTVITDGFITDDGVFKIKFASYLQFLDSDGAGALTQVYVGDPDSQAGLLMVSGDTAGQVTGGEVRVYTAADHDGTGIDYFTIKVSSDDLQIGPHQLPTALHFVGSGVDAATWGSWVFNTAVDVDAALTATTVDADTDFTVGGTVITDGVITDTGEFIIVAPDGIILKDGAGAGADALVGIGLADTERGILSIYSDNNTSGGIARWYIAPDDDGNGTVYWQIRVVDSSDDFHIGADNDTSMLQFLGGAAPSIVISAGWTAAGETCADLGTVTTANIDGGTIDGTTIGGGTPAAGAFTTVDASTDVTLGAGAPLKISEPSVDTTATGIVLTGQTVDTNAFGYGGVVYLNAADGNWDTADHDAATTGPAKMIGMALGTTGAVDILLQGIVYNTAYNWTASAQLFLGDDGACTETAPAVSGDFVRVMGHAIDADRMYFNPSPDFMEVL